MRIAEFLARFGELSDEAFSEAFPHPFLLEEGKLKAEVGSAASNDRHVFLLSSPGGRTLVVGRNPSCDIPVSDKQVSSKHAELRAGPDGRWVVVDKASTNGTFVDGVRIDPASPHPLPDGTSLRFGPDTAFMVITPESFLPLFRRMQARQEEEEVRATELLGAQTDPVGLPARRVREAVDAEAKAKKKPRGPELFLHCAGVDPVRLEIGQPVVIGRSPGHAQMLLVHSQVSRAHAEVLRSETGVVVRDLASANGTFLCQVRVGDAPTPLPIGKPLTLGPFTVTLQGPPSDSDLGVTISIPAGAGGVQGRLDESPLSDLLTEVESEHKTGTIDIRGLRGGGKITFRGGQPHDARTDDGKTGPEAVRALLALREGTWALRSDPSGIGPKKIERSFSDLVLEDFLGDE